MPAERRGCARGGVEGAGPPRTFCVALQGKPGSLLGATLADCSGDVDGAVIAHVSPGGLLHEWNRKATAHSVETGDTIVRVNGATGYWSILSQIKKMGSLDIVVQKAASGDGSRGQASFEHDVVTQCLQGDGSLLLHLPRQGDEGCCPVGSETSVVALPIVRSSGCGSEQCSICLEAFQAEENLVQLPCRHEFHAECMYKWLHCSSQGRCPLCSRPVFNIGPDGGS